MARTAARPRSRSEANIPFPREARTDLFTYAASLGADPSQLAFARELNGRGLPEKARRAALCSLLGHQVVCAGAPSHVFYRKFRCGLRGCLTCSRIASKKSIETYEPRIRLAAPRLAEECRKRGQLCVSARIEFVADTGKASPEDVQQFDEHIKSFFNAAKKGVGVGKESSGLIATTQVDGDTIRAVALYVGPRLPDEVIAHWTRIAGPDARIAITPQRSTSMGVREALAPLENGPAAMAQLEAACDGVRRIRTLGGFYAKGGTPKEEHAKQCPLCGSELLNVYAWMPITELEAVCIGELNRIRHKVHRITQMMGPPGDTEMSMAVL
jgi:hypothetical protein